MIESCAQCGFEPLALPRGGEADALRTAISGYPAALARARTGSQAGGWSAPEYVGHVRDVCALFGRRIQQLVATEDPQLEVIDHDDVVARGEYATADHAELIESLSVEAERLAGLIESLRDEDWERVGTRAGEARTVREVAQRAVHEARHHLADIGGVVPPE